MPYTVDHIKSGVGPIFYRVFIVWFCLSWAWSGYAQESQDPRGLLTQAQGQRAEPDTHLALLEQAVVLIEQQPEPDYGLMGDVFIEMSKAQVNAGQLDLARVSADRGLKVVNQRSHPNQYMRLRSILPILDMVGGDTEQAVASFRTLLAEDHSAADPATVDSVQVSYATILHENGQMVLAQEIYQDVLTRALQRGDELFVLQVANNLIVLLIYQGLYDDARDWLRRIEQPRSRADYPFLIYSLRLHEIELAGLFGDRQGAVRDFRRFIDNIDDATPRSIAGNAYEYLADALFALGEYAEARVAADTAVEILEDLTFELIEARQTLIRTLLVLGEFDEAESILKTFENAVLNSPRQARVSALRLELTLRRSGNERAVVELDKLLSATQQDIRSNAVQSIQYYDAKLTSARQAAEISRMREAERVLSADAKASDARASELLAREQAGRRSRNLILAIVVLSALALVAILYAINRRSYQKRVLANQQALNRELSRQVDEKSEALVRQLNEQAELQRALDRKKQTELVGQIASNVAHDFNNLLQVISSANEQLEPLAKTPGQISALKASSDSVQYASDMTYQLLAYSRQQELKATVTNVSQLLRGTQTLFRSAVGEEIQLHFDECDRDAIALVDPAKLTSAILNLLRNAADAMEVGGKIALCIEHQTLGQQVSEHWRSLKPGPYVFISVTDSGHGMGPEALERACEPFFTTKADTSGTGLGLSSVYGFVRQSEGDLRLESTLGQGSRVTLAIPASEQEMVPTQRPVQDKDCMQGKRVLVVEDNPMVAKTVSLALSSVGVEVSCLESADDAIEHLSGGVSYDFLLTDVRMPGANDGYDLARWVSQQSHETSVIIMSGYTDRTDSSHDYPVINKPFTRGQLVACLRQADRQPAVNA